MELTQPDGLAPRSCILFPFCCNKPPDWQGSHRASTSARHLALVLGALPGARPWSETQAEHRDAVPRLGRASSPPSSAGWVVSRVNTKI